MPSFSVNYTVAGKQSSGPPNDLFESTGASHYTMSVQAQNTGAARDMVINMNGGHNNCRVNAVYPA